MDDDRRRPILVSLLKLDRPIAEIQALLMAFEWDFPIALVKLTSDHIRNILESLKAGMIEPANIEKWADFVEGRDDIEYEDENTKEVLHILANPILYGKLNDDTVEKLLIQISK